MTESASAELSPRRLLDVLALVFVMLAGSAMLRTSATFDEIVFMSVGARGMHTGDFALVHDHPRLPQYIYGAPAWLAASHFPPEDGRWSGYARYRYSQAFLWGSGNSPERIVMSARIVGLAFGLATVLAVFFLSRRELGEWGALLAAALVAFLPDVLAHSGVAYNDVPVALGMLLSVYALDAAVRRPRPAKVALAALACALAFCIKFSAVVLGPVLVALLAMEAWSGRWRDAAWRRALLPAAALFAVVAYVTIALVYLGDWRLADLVGGLREITRTTLAPRGAFLLGEHRLGGWWYFFPAAFVLKTPVALHVLILVAIGAAGLSIGAGRLRQWLSSPLRAPAAAVALFLATLFAARLNIGLRHALPMMPLLCILVAAGVRSVWMRAGRAARVALGVVLVAYPVSALSSYPYFLSYVSEYARGRPLFETLVDSNTDWGQGLVGLRDYMRTHRIEQVALGYFGSAVPEGYGIRYVAMPSFFELQGGTAGAPRYLAVSATLLAGEYTRGDPYAELRRARPVAVVGGSIYLYDRQSVEGR